MSALMWASAARTTDASTDAEPAGSSSPPGRQVFVNELRVDIREATRALTALAARPEAALLFLIPVAIYFLFIHEYGVNAIWYDQWQDVALLTHSNFYFHSYSGHTSLGMLWIQHNENRQLFPNLIVLALGALTHLNVLTEVYLNALLLAIATWLIVLTSRRDLRPMPWIVYLPVVFLMLSLAQFGDTLFGFNLVWYLTLLAFAAVIFLLDSPRTNWVVLVAAIGVAVVGSFSSLEGLFIWPAGLIILIWNHWRRAFLCWRG